MAAVAAIYPRLKQLGAEVLAISTDSIYSHKVFRETSPSMRHVRYPLLSDRNHRISRTYGVLDEKAGAAIRSTVMVNPEGVIEAKIVYPSEVGRYVPETVRLLEGLQFARQTGLGVPANWVPGLPGIKRDIRRAGEI
ncbi:peroxiredoxin [Alicyclobacillus mengziensis]|uniref:Peroxiredoxin n=1 Tax=Alicyclobacillus mengziensis TaxID=2931921 RepID=A0A9X7Z6Y2_9BACL|nr:peroxiredoxin [Alicyclobacillus mengziensis]